MISRKSSINPFAFTYRETLRTSFTLPALLTAFISLMTVVVPKINFLSYKEQAESSLMQGGEQMPGLATIYKYVITDNGTLFMAVLLHIAVIATAVAMGIQVFRFISSKKAVNVYYSLGISRKSLFTSRYLGGATLLFAAVFLPFLASFILNITEIGFSRELLMAELFHVLSYFVLALATYSITAFVFSGVGTVAESSLYTLVILAAPSILIYCIERLINTFTLGAPFGYFNELDSMNNSLLTRFMYLSPVTFAFNGLESVGTLRRESADVDFPTVVPNFAPVLCWLAVCAAIFVAGMFIFKRRKAEICGFLGMNRPLTAAVIFSLGFYFMTLFVTGINPFWAGILAGAAAFLLVFCIADFAIVRSFRQLGRDFKKIPLYFAASAVIMVIFTTGFFGFSSRIPDKADIESVDVGAAYNSVFGDNGCMETWNYGGIFSGGSGALVSGYKSDEDVEKILELHKMFIDAGKLSNDTAADSVKDETVGTRIRFAYHLKNGKIMFRYYDRATLEMLEKMLTLSDTDRLRDLTGAAFRQKMTDEEIEKADNMEGSLTKSILQSENRMTGFASPLLEGISWQTLTPEQNNELDSALMLDLKEQTVEEKFFPKDDPLGIIYLAQNSSGNPDKPGSEPGIPASSTDIKVYTSDDGVSYSIAAEELGLCNYSYIGFVIDGSMEHTKAFIDKYALGKKFERKTDIVSAQLIDISPDGLKKASSELGEGSFLSYYTNEGLDREVSQYITVRHQPLVYDESTFYGWDFFSDFTNGNKDEKITDPAKLAELYGAAYCAYFNSRDGYAVRFILSDGSSTVMYIPASELPAGIV